jgi:hypothetical protein
LKLDVFAELREYIKKLKGGTTLWIIENWLNHTPNKKSRNSIFDQRTLGLFGYKPELSLPGKAIAWTLPALCLLGTPRSCLRGNNCLWPGYQNRLPGHCSGIA